MTMMPQVDRLTFNYHVLSRIFTILPRKSKKIKMLYIDYGGDEKQGRLLKYKFTNALWFKIGDSKTLATRIPLPDATPDELEITVQGLFRKNIYTLLLKPDHIHVIKVQQN